MMPTEMTHAVLVWTVTELEPTRTFTWVARQPGLCFEAVHRIDVAGEGVRATLEFIVTGPLAWADQFIPRDGERGPEAGRRDGLITGPRAGDCAAQRAAPRTTR